MSKTLAAAIAARAAKFQNIAFPNELVYDAEIEAHEWRWISHDVADELSAVSKGVLEYWECSRFGAHGVIEGVGPIATSRPKQLMINHDGRAYLRTSSGSVYELGAELELF